MRVWFVTIVFCSIYARAETGGKPRTTTKRAMCEKKVKIEWNDKKKTTLRTSRRLAVVVPQLAVDSNGALLSRAQSSWSDDRWSTIIHPQTTGVSSPGTWRPTILAPAKFPRVLTTARYGDIVKFYDSCGNDNRRAPGGKSFRTYSRRGGQKHVRE